MGGLQGKHVAVTGARKGSEISTLIEKQGGIPYIRPTQGTIFMNESQIEGELDKLFKAQADWLILTTGIGTKTLLDGAQKLGRERELLDLMQHTRVASRGYKTKAVLRELGIVPDVQDDDGTVRGLIRAFDGIDLQGKNIALQLYGEKSDKLTSWLKKAGAHAFEVMPYEHIPPEIEEVTKFIEEIQSGQFDAIAFTSALQVTFLFDLAEQLGMRDVIVKALNGPVVAVAVGVVTAEALEDAGVQRIIQPKLQRMGAMIATLNQYFATAKEE